MSEEHQYEIKVIIQLPKTRPLYIITQNSAQSVIQMIVDEINKQSPIKINLSSCKIVRSHIVINVQSSSPAFLESQTDFIDFLTDSFKTYHDTLKEEKKRFITESAQEKSRIADPKKGFMPIDFLRQ